MNTQELISLATDVDGLAGNTITLYGPESLDYLATFDHEGVALVPLDVAAVTSTTPGFKVGAEHFDLVATYNARQLEIARSPIPTYDAGEPVYLHIPSLAGINGIQGLDMVAGDNLKVVFDGEGKTECGELTALTFLASFPDSIIKRVNEPVAEVEPEVEDESDDEAETEADDEPTEAETDDEPTEDEPSAKAETETEVAPPVTGAKARKGTGAKATGAKATGAKATGATTKRNKTTEKAEVEASVETDAPVLTNSPVETNEIKTEDETSEVAAQTDAAGDNVNA